ncbi:MAG: alpha/beta fold hydrolase [Rhodobacteraceae bacterium]|nr:alpha/beta fold hydrolase [Paracoccaceae bacterium]
MRTFGKWLGRVLLALLVVAGGLWVFGPYEEVDLQAEFEPRKFGEGVQVYFESIESRFDDITPGVEKRVVWAGQQETRTPISVLYVHGFSATSEEIRPVPDEIASTLGANLVYTRLTGHGRPGAAMVEATPNAWMQDLAEALAAARHVGDRVVVISTSTGGTLSAAAALDSDLSRDVAAMIFVSPNFGVNDPLDFMLTWPASRWWLPIVMGGERSFDSDDPDQNTYWTRSYSWEAVVPMAALVQEVAVQDFGAANIPALFWFSMDDQVVRPEETVRIADRWGGPAEVVNVTMGPGDDPSSHVIAGRIVSPGQTVPAVAGMLDWLAEQGIE